MGALLACTTRAQPQPRTCCAEAPRPGHDATLADGHASPHRAGGATIYDELQRHLQTKHLPLRHIQFATHGAILTDFAVHLDSPVFTQRIAAYIVHCLVEAESVALPEPLAKRGDASGVLTLADCKAALPMDLQRPVGDAMKAISVHVRRHEPTSPKDALCPLGSGRDKSEEDAGEEASIEAKALGHKAMLLLWALGHCAKVCAPALPRLSAGARCPCAHTRLSNRRSARAALTESCGAAERRREAPCPAVRVRHRV